MAKAVDGVQVPSRLKSDFSLRSTGNLTACKRRVALEVQPTTLEEGGLGRTLGQGDRAVIISTPSVWPPICAPSIPAASSPLFHFYLPPSSSCFPWCWEDMNLISLHCLPAFTCLSLTIIIAASCDALIVLY